MRRAPALVALAWVLASQPAWAASQAAGVTATVSSARVRLGEPFHYRIAITRPKDERFDLAVPSDTGAFSVLERARHRDDGATAATTTFDLKLGLYDLGPRKLPDLFIDGAGPAGHVRIAVTGPEVTALAASAKKDDKLADIAGPDAVWVRSLALIAALAASLLALVLGLFLLRRRRRHPLPLEQRTRAALDALGASALPEHGRTQEFFFALDDIVRRHLGERYALDALECTTSELVARLTWLRAPGLPDEELTRFLRAADLVKFARASVSLDACQEALAFGYRVVDLARPLPANGDTHARAAVS